MSPEIQEALSKTSPVETAPEGTPPQNLNVEAKKSLKRLDLEDDTLERVVEIVAGASQKAYKLGHVDGFEAAKKVFENKLTPKPRSFWDREII